MHSHDDTGEMRAALNAMFTAFPMHVINDETRRERKRQYQLYYQRLRELPADLVHRAIFELIDSAAHLPRIGAIRSRVLAHMRQSQSAAPVPAVDDPAERTVVARTLAALLQRGTDEDTRRGRCRCGRMYEYSPVQAGLLRADDQPLLCHRCAGVYLARQSQEAR